MTKYVWKSRALHKRNRRYAWLCLTVMAMALACVIVLPSVLTNRTVPFWIALCLMAVALAFMLLSWKAQSDDKRSKT